MKKNIILIAVGTLMNYGLFLLCSMLLDLPVWFDTTGTAVVAMLAGFWPAAVVAVINALLTSLHFGFSTLPFVLVSLGTAAVFAFFSRKGQIRTFVSVCGVVFIHMIVRIGIITLIMYITGTGIVNTYEVIGFNAFQEAGYSLLSSYIFALFTTNVQEAIGMAILIFGSHKLLLKIASLSKKSLDAGDTKV